MKSAQEQVDSLGPTAEEIHSVITFLPMGCGSMFFPVSLLVWPCLPAVAIYSTANRESEFTHKQVCPVQVPKQDASYEMKKWQKTMSLLFSLLILMQYLIFNLKHKVTKIAKTETPTSMCRKNQKIMYYNYSISNYIIICEGIYKSWYISLMCSVYRDF